MLTIYDSFGDQVGQVEALGERPTWDGLGRTAIDIADDNEGWIEDEEGVTVYG